MVIGDHHSIDDAFKTFESKRCREKSKVMKKRTKQVFCVAAENIEQ